MASKIIEIAKIIAEENGGTFEDHFFEAKQIALLFGYKCSHFHVLKDRFSNNAVCEDCGEKFTTLSG